MRWLLERACCRFCSSEYPLLNEKGQIHIPFHNIQLYPKVNIGYNLYDLTLGNTWIFYHSIIKPSEKNWGLSYQLEKSLPFLMLFLQCSVKNIYYLNALVVGTNHSLSIKSWPSISICRSPDWMKMTLGCPHPSTGRQGYIFLTKSICSVLLEIIPSTSKLYELL